MEAPPVLLVAAACLVLARDPEVERFAIKEAKARVDDILKSPKSAEYGVSLVEPSEPDSVLVPGRLMVKGFVDSRNGFGAEVRVKWVAVVRAPKGETPELLALVYEDTDGDAQVLYVARPSRRYSPEVYKKVKADFEAMTAKYRKRLASVPLKKRGIFLDRYVNEFVQGGKKYGLNAVQMKEIVEDVTKAAQ